ncbi:MAG: hypothetical protein K0U68_15870 [Gammaproteobacteria bacterium]|nr:hypothetical protein [Gammaproteobacteria bacterium]
MRILQRKSLKTSVISTLLLSICCLVLTAGNVSGAERGEYDAKYFPGSVCRDTSGLYQEAAVYTDMGYVINTQPNKRLSVVCPILRDNVANRLGAGGIGIYYADNHPQEDIVCRVRSRRLSGRSYDHSSSIRSSGTGSDTLWIGNAVITRPNDSYIYLDCTIPASTEEGDSAIKSISVIEHKS